MDTTRTERRTRTGLAAAAAALAAMTLVLAGCGGGGDSKVEGSYYNDEGRLSIQGTSVEYHDFGCDGNHYPAVDEDPSATGELSRDGTQIVWASDDEKLVDSIVKGTDGVTVSDSGDSITIKSHTFTSMDEKDALAGYKKCNNSAKG